jgi:hypothetical protein
VLYASFYCFVLQENVRKLARTFVRAGSEKVWGLLIRLSLSTVLL